MKIFSFDNTYNAVCLCEKTRYGFRHVAVLHKNGFEVGRTKCCYYNRTWESYEYESVLQKLVETFFDGTEQKKYLKVIADNTKF